MAFNPIPAGVLENQDMLGGINLTPPYKSHVWCPNMTNDTSLESSCALLLESAKKLQICKNRIFYRKIQLYSKNVCKKSCPKNEKLYIFEKPLTMPFQICKNFCKILYNLIFNQEKLEMCKLSLTGCLQKICNFFSQNLCNSFPYVKGFPKS